MKITKREVIDEMIESAQRTIFKNELSIAYRQRKGYTPSAKEEKEIASAELSITLDQEYIAFLQDEQNKCA